MLSERQNSTLMTTFFPAIRNSIYKTMWRVAVSSESKEKQRKAVYERAESAAKWQDPLHMTRGLLQKLRTCIHYTLSECVETLERETKSCHDFWFPGAVNDGSVGFASAHTSLLHRWIPYSQYSRLRGACHMAAVFETKTKSAFYHDLL